MHFLPPGDTCMRLRRLIEPLLVLLWLMPLAATAQDTSTERERLEQRAQEIVAVLNGEKPPEEVFTDAFNAQVTEPQLRAMTQQMQAQMGKLVGVEGVEPTGEPGAATLKLRFEQAIASGPMQLEAEEPYEVAGLRLVQFDPVTDSETPVLEQVAELPGEANLLLARLDGSEPVLAHNPDQPLALGSAFKLYVLSTLVQDVAAGRRAWDDVVTLDTVSYISGILQDWPAGTPMTLQSLATLMISISDNTATDQLIATLGREAVEAEIVASGHSSPDLTLPLMTTREMFVLKSDEEVNIGEYASLGTPERLAVLESLQQRDVALDQVVQAFEGAPKAIEVEWFASPTDLARVLDRIKDDPVALGIMGVNTAIGDEAAAKWDYVGYKGGSEPGVLNMTWLLRRDPPEASGQDTGQWYVLTLGWNNPEAAVAPAKLLGLARQALEAVPPATE
jgi:beta-lactamase class A